MELVGGALDVARVADLGPAAEPVTGPAIAFLAARRASDGPWEEDPSIASSGPPRVRPGNPAARLSLTASCAFWTGGVDPRPADLLARSVDATCRLPSFPHTQWLAAAVPGRVDAHAGLAPALLDGQPFDVATTIAAVRCLVDPHKDGPVA